MRIGLIDVDGHRWPNLALMKLSAWHKTRGDTVEWWDGFAHYGRVYMSRVFDDTYSVDEPEPCNADEIVKGGTGYGLQNRLPDAVEHMTPDYGLYGITDTAYGFLTRGCPRACPFCIVAEKEGRKARHVADLSEFWDGQREIKLLDPNLLAAENRMELLGQLADSRALVDFTQGLDARLLTQDNIAALNQVRIKMLHFAWDSMAQSDAVLSGLALYARYGKLDERRRRVYVLTNYDTTQEEDLYRVYHLREMQYDPYVMVYNKPHASRETRRLQRWVNNKFIWRACARFEDYNSGGNLREGARQ
ncbi:hypothetical protein [Intestinibacillus massiliensis]|uniref:hypothetical protein n=1 Tax=Intestinibacillus massiliensis TaxID=1871029 RepID=UPI000B3536ED|nr:hypothetical protein [Intestinibacillus massiliensis]